MINFWIAAILSRLHVFFYKMLKICEAGKTFSEDRLIRQIIKRSKKIHKMTTLLEKQERKVIKARQEVAQLIHEYRQYKKTTSY